MTLSRNESKYFYSSSPSLTTIDLTIVSSLVHERSVTKSLPTNAVALLIRISHKLTNFLSFFAKQKSSRAHHDKKKLALVSLRVFIIFSIVQKPSKYVTGFQCMTKTFGLIVSGRNVFGRCNKDSSCPKAKVNNTYLSFTIAHFKGLARIMPYSEAALQPTQK